MGPFLLAPYLHRSRRGIISMTEYTQMLLKNLVFLIGLRLGIQILKSQNIFTSTSCTLLQGVFPLCLHDCGCLLFLACAEEILLRHSQSMVLLQNLPLSLTLHLHLPSLPVVLLLPLSPCIRHVSLRLRFQVSLTVVCTGCTKSPVFPRGTPGL